MVISSVPHPCNLIKPEVPEIIPPIGTVSEWVIPLALATGISSESGLTATQASIPGVCVPTSDKSLVGRSALISARPREDPGLINPG